MTDFAMRRTCAECPWLLSSPVGKFPPERYVRLAPTCQRGGIPKVFACHMTPEGEERACAGALAVHGRDNNLVRIALGRGWWDGTAEASGPLYPSYRALAEANGVPPDHPALEGGE